jgi:hypothetical protein
MEETLNPTAETVAPVENAAAPSTPQERLNALLARRMGEFDVKITYTDLKYVRNLINQKIEWKGANEAYVMIMAYLSLDKCLQEMDQKEGSSIQIKFPASTVESVNFFMNRVTGTGIDSAQRLFSISMIFRPAMEAIRKLDEEIEFVKNELEIKSEKNS